MNTQYPFSQTGLLQLPGLFRLVMLLLLSAGVLALLIPRAGYAQTNPASFSYTGDVQVFTVPTGVTTLTVVANGARGSGDLGGRGGRVTATLTVTPGQSLSLYVGQRLSIGQQPSSTGQSYNGGGAAGSFRQGGGATDIRIGGTALSDRIVIAGGGGGGSQNSNFINTTGGEGGGLTAFGGANSTGGFGDGSAGGGSQSGGGSGGTGGGGNGSLGQGGDGVRGTIGTPTGSLGGGGGGGGYYGGGGGGLSGGGGGGSSYPDPANLPLSNGGVTVTSVVHQQGANNGNGSITISWAVAAQPCVFVPQNITVTGISEAFDGVYIPSQIDGELQWKKDDTHFLYWFADLNRWEIGDATDDGIVAYNTTGSATNLPCSGWVDNNGDPAPTINLSGGCGSLTGEPSVSITATPSLTVTSGGSVTLTASGATTYTWSNGVQSTSVVLTNVSSATILSVTGVTGVCSATASAAVSVTVGSSPCVFVPQNITVSGMSGALNGVYTPFGTYNAAPQWASAGNDYLLSWNTFNRRWELGDGDAVFAYVSTNALIMNLPCSGWVGNNSYGAPMLSGGCGSLSGGPNLSITATPSQTITSGGSVTLTASGAESFTWSNGVQSTSVVLTNVISATTLSVTGVTGVCSATASAAVSVTQASDPCASTIPGSIVLSGSNYDLFNGTYTRVADFGGVPSWSQVTQNGILTVRWSGSRWELRTSNNTNVLFYASGSSVALPCAIWTPDQSGSSPPTITQGCGAFSSGLSVSVSPSSPTITSGGSVTLTGSGATSYTWSNGSTQNPLVLTNVTSATTLSVTGTTGACSATASAAVSLTTNCAPFVPQNITASGFNAAGESLQGTYVPNGTLNGAPRWSNGTASIVWLGSRWEMVNSGSLFAFNNTGSITNLPATDWFEVDGSGVIIGRTPILTGGVGSLAGGPIVDISPSSQTITSGGSVTLTASGADSFTWSNGVESMSVVLTNVTSATTLSVTGTTGACSATASAAVSVTAPPGPSITVGPLTGTATACAGTVSSEMTFTVSGTNLSTTPGNALQVIAPPGFEILGLDGYTNQDGIPIPANGSVPPTTIYVRTTSAAPSGNLAGSITLTSSGATTQTLAVSATVISVTANISSANLTICSGTSTTLTASGGTLLWNTGSNLSAISVSPTSTTAYQLTVSTGGCSATATATVTVNPSVTATITPYPGLVLCPGSSAVLTASGAGLGGSYHWNTSAITPTISVSTSGPYTVTATSAAGCSGTATVTVSVTNPAPLSAPVLSASSLVVCEGGAVSVSATVNGTVTYQWYKDGQSLGAAQQTPVLSLAGLMPSQAGSYVLVIQADGCASATSTAVTITVNPLPTVTITFPTSAVVNPAGPVITVPVGAGLSYQVFGGGSNGLYERKIVLDRLNGFEIRTTMENRDGIFPIDKAGPYTITVTDGNGCSRTVTGEIRGQ